MISYRHDRERAARPAKIIILQTPRQLAADIKATCQLVGISVSRFGRDAVGDPCLYYDIADRGRQLRGDTRARVLMHLNRIAIDHARRVDARAAMARLDRDNARKVVSHA